MKIKTAYIFISLLGLQFEVQAPPKKPGSRAKVFETSAITVNDGTIAPDTSFSNSPENTLRQQFCTGAALAAKYDVPVEPIRMDELDDEASKNDLQEAGAMPSDTHKSSAVFAAQRDVAGTPPLNVLEIQEKAHLDILQHDWDIAEEDLEESTESKGWTKILAGIPKSVWEKHVADNYRIERLLREVGAVQTYKILSHKAKNGSLPVFISRLNQRNGGEGDTWINEAACQAVEDEQEEELKSFLIPEIKPAMALTGRTRTMVLEYLNCCGRAKKEAHDTYAKHLESIIESLNKHQPSQAAKSNDDDDE